MSQSFVRNQGSADCEKCAIMQLIVVLMEEWQSNRPNGQVWKLLRAYLSMFFKKWKIKIVQTLKHLYEIKTTQTANAQTCRELWSSGTAVVPIDKKQMSLGLFSIGEVPSLTLITTRWTDVVGLIQHRWCSVPHAHSDQMESYCYVLKRRRGVSFFKKIKIVKDDHNHSCEIKATQTARCANLQRSMVLKKEWQP